MQIVHQIPQTENITMEIGFQKCAEQETGEVCHGAPAGFHTDPCFHQVTSLTNTPSLRLEERLHHLMEGWVGVKTWRLFTLGPATLQAFSQC